MELINSSVGEMLTRFPNGSIMKDLFPVLIWKSSVIWGVKSLAEREIVLSETLSTFMISFARTSFSPVQMLTNFTFEELRLEVMSESLRLLILETGSFGFQKFITTYLPSRSDRSLSREWEERVRAGASLPISREWLPIGIEDDKKAANTKDKNKYLVFTITCFCYTIVNQRHI